jgi:hypothetical protein
MGGKKGQCLDRLVKQHSELPAHNIFQDLPTVICGVVRDIVAAEPMSHDFFTAQPVHGARFYHLGAILHDWPDAEWVEILSHLQSRFEKGYCRLMIETFGLPETGCTPVEPMNTITRWTCCGM